MDFGRTLRVLRISTGTSLRHLAKDVGLSPTYLSHIETGKLPPPNQSRVSKIEEALKIPKGALFHLTDRLDEKVAFYLNDITEATTFLRTAFDEGMKEEDFLDLTEILTKNGLKGMRRMLSRAKTSMSAGTSSDSQTQLFENIFPLSDYLRRELVFLRFKASTKQEALNLALGKFKKVFPELDTEVLFDTLLQREEQTSTGIGDGIGIPHLATDQIEKTTIGLFRFPSGIPFDSIDDEPVRLMFLILGPEVEGEMHLQMLARIAQLLKHDYFKDKLLTTDSVDALLRLFVEADERIV